MQQDELVREKHINMFTFTVFQPEWCSNWNDGIGLGTMQGICSSPVALSINSSTKTIKQEKRRQNEGFYECLWEANEIQMLCLIYANFCLNLTLSLTTWPVNTPVSCK